MKTSETHYETQFSKRLIIHCHSNSGRVGRDVHYAQIEPMARGNGSDSWECRCCKGGRIITSGRYSNKRQAFTAAQYWVDGNV
jgi:hypothetical protein